MANKFAVAPQTVQVGPVANGVTLTFYYDFTDHSVVKVLVTPTGTLAAQTMVTFNRNGLATNAPGVTGASIPTQDTSVAINLEQNSGDPADSLVAHGAGFGV
jgi:hypothetical protein